MKKLRPLAISLLGLTDWHIYADREGYLWRRYSPRNGKWEVRPIDAPEIVPDRVREALRTFEDGVTLMFLFESEDELVSSDWYEFAKQHKLISTSIGSWQNDGLSVSITNQGRAVLGAAPEEDAFARLGRGISLAKAALVNRWAVQ